MGSRAVAAVFALGLTLSGGGAAHAFCRTTTVAVAPDFQPSRDQCWDMGVPLFWRNSCVGYSIQRNASRQVSYEDAATQTTAAFTKWSGSTCPADPSGRSRVSIDVRDLGPVDCAAVDYDTSGPNQNVIVFRDEKWPHEGTSNTLALTTVTFNPNTGEIYDADMEVNTFEQRVTLTDPVPENGYDFASIATHEAGHFLGLAHSGDARATMYASYTPGATNMRNLTADDVLGICTVYTPSGARPVGAAGDTAVGASCDPTPRRGYTKGCAEEKKKSCTGGSHVAASTETPWWTFGAIAGVIGLALVRARRR